MERQRGARPGFCGRQVHVQVWTEGKRPEDVEKLWCFWPQEGSLQGQSSEAFLSDRGGREL